MTIASHSPPEDRPALRVGVVGCGFFSQFHLDAWHRIGISRLTSVADTDPAKLRATAAKYPGIAAYPTLAEMLRGSSLDLVDIATPPQTHVKLVTEAIEFGLPVVCQKPFCTSLQEARDLTALAELRGVALIVHENFRFEPWYRETKKLLDSARLGELYQITFRLRPGDGQGPDAYLGRQPYFQKMPRFLIRETGVHFIDVFRYLFGPINAVSAHLARLNPVIAGEDAGLVIFEFGSGQRGIFDANRLVDHISDNRRRTMGEMLIEGSSAVLRLDGFGRLYLREHGSNAEFEHPFAWEDKGYGGDCVKLCLNHVADALQRGVPAENAASEYLKNLEIEDAVYRSHDLRRTVSLDP